MLQFISNCITAVIFCITFKNISCYSLSRATLDGTNAVNDLKTSHVTVYPSWRYVSILSVSNLKTSHVTVYRYGSLTAKGIAQHLKTSHVTVYLSGGRFICLGSTDLKTSHVTVYLSRCVLIP